MPVTVNGNVAHFTAAGIKDIDYKDVDILKPLHYGAWKNTATSDYRSVSLSSKTFDGCDQARADYGAAAVRSQHVT